MASAKLLTAVDQGVALLTMNRPEARNALDTELVAALKEALVGAASSPEVRTVVLTGAGVAFCAGADLKQRQGMTDDQLRAHTDSILECANLLESLPVPVIAAVNGPAYAGGMELALGCDLRIAAQSASFALPEITLGIFPGAGGPLRLPKLVGRGWAKMMVLTGDRIGAEEAFRIGLVERLATSESLIQEALALGRRLGRGNPAAVRAAKTLINSIDDMSFGAAIELSAALRHPLNAAARWSEGLSRQT